MGQPHLSVIYPAGSTKGREKEISLIRALWTELFILWAFDGAQYTRWAARFASGEGHTVLFCRSCAKEL